MVGAVHTYALQAPPSTLQYDVWSAVADMIGHGASHTSPVYSALSVSKHAPNPTDFSTRASTDEK
ncbi:hypothetical protein SDC9_150930 [bioreactor metagenome]|uniref:Uncharacterized protein n=1 Tax=bioreactor metagenome TaxID=1076179 RepID=A0A645ENV6_9ZZZZ